MCVEHAAISISISIFFISLPSFRFRNDMLAFARRQCARFSMSSCVNFIAPSWINTSAPWSIQSWENMNTIENMKYDCFSTHSRCQKLSYKVVPCASCTLRFFFFFFIYVCSPSKCSTCIISGGPRSQNQCKAIKEILFARSQSAWACVYLWFYYNYSIRDEYIFHGMNDDGRRRGGGSAHQT